MANRPNPAGPVSKRSGEHAIDALARRVVEVVADRQSSLERRLDAALLRRFCEAVSALDSKEHVLLVAEMMASGVRAEDITDLYVPAAARVLGDRWCEDNMSFADVTIGSARLQSLLRWVGPEWQPGWKTPVNAPLVLVYVRPDEYHTLGAMVATGQLRRAGCEVLLHIGYDRAETLDVIEREPIDIVMISASGGERLESVRKLIEDMRKRADDTISIAVGGSILLNYDDVRSLTGADYAEQDPKKVLRLCGVKIQASAVDLSGTKN